MMEVTLRRLLEEIPRFGLVPGQDLHYFSMPTRGIHEFEIDFESQDRPER